MIGPVPTIEVWPGQELPDTTIDWYETPGVFVDLSAAHSYELRVAAVDTPATVVFTKTTGITGSSSSPNVTISWSTTGELSLLSPGTVYRAQLRARRSADNKDRYLEFRIVTRDVI